MASTLIAQLASKPPRKLTQMVLRRAQSVLCQNVASGSRRVDAADPTFFRPLCLLCCPMPPLTPVLLVLAVGFIAAGSVLARRVGFVVPFAFIAAYALGVGALTLLNIGVFDMADPKFREKWVESWLEIYWPLWTIFFAPSAICALLATWFSRATGRRDAARMLGVCFVLILVAIEIAWALDSYGPRALLGAIAIPSSIFFAIALVVRVRRANDPLPDRAP